MQTAATRMNLTLPVADRLDCGRVARSHCGRGFGDNGVNDEGGELAPYELVGERHPAISTGPDERLHPPSFSFDE